MKRRSQSAFVDDVQVLIDEVALLPEERDDHAKDEIHASS